MRSDVITCEAFTTYYFPKCVIHSVMMLLEKFLGSGYNKISHTIFLINEGVGRIVSFLPKFDFIGRWYVSDKPFKGTITSPPSQGALLFKGREASTGLGRI